MDIKILYEDKDMLVVDKPAGMVVFPEGQTKDGTVIDALIVPKPELKSAGEAPRYGVVHRLDKDTSGILLVAKSSEALIFLQKQFKTRGVEKKYVCLVEGVIKEDSGTMNTLLARSPNDPRKQTVYRHKEAAPESAREAITEYKVLKRFTDFTLVEAHIKTGRKHQIRAQFAALQHPLAGDKLYQFKNSKGIDGLNRQFLHAEKLTIELPNGETKTFESPLPEDLENALDAIET